ncbi:MAG: tRNA lysidine(34) synthetase TilS [Deltaproteobacteria bacterium]|nr:tRNA lysidine(34) synthetase TilS [Deltaproteobacteria bacterium]
MKQLLKAIKDSHASLPQEARGLPIIIAASGGLDSTVLLHGLYQLRQALPVLVVAHVNYGLRGKESDEDQAFTEQLCQLFSLRCFVLQKKIGTKANDLQNKARKIRYDFFTKIASELKGAIIATAHQRDDQVETFLLRLVQGASSHGLGGMEEFSAGLWRPLLKCPRQALEKIAQENKIEFRTDSSNQTDKYLRNKIRQQLLPLLKTLNPRIEEHIAKTATHLRSQAQWVMLMAEKFLTTHREKTGKGFSLPIIPLKEAPRALRCQVLQQAWKELSNNLPLNSKKLAQLEQAVLFPQKKRQFIFKDPILIEQTRYRISFKNI